MFFVSFYVYTSSIFACLSVCLNKLVLPFHLPSLRHYRPIMKRIINNIWYGKLIQRAPFNNKTIPFSSSAYKIARKIIEIFDIVSLRLKNVDLSRLSLSLSDTKFDSKQITTIFSFFSNKRQMKNERNHQQPTTEVFYLLR